MNAKSCDADVLLHDVVSFSFVYGKIFMILAHVVLFICMDPMNKFGGIWTLISSISFPKPSILCAIRKGIASFLFV